MAFIAINTNLNNTGLVTITLTTEQKHFTFIIDTGSNVSHIDAEAAKLLQNSTKIPIVDNSVTGINGSFNSISKIQQYFSSGIFKFHHEFFVTDLSSMIKAIKDSNGTHIHGILGTDFLIKYRSHLDFKKNRLHLG